LPLQAEQIRKALEPKKAEVSMTEDERGEALTLLKDPKLLDRIIEDLDRCGLVGEESNFQGRRETIPIRAARGGASGAGSWRPWAGIGKDSTSVSKSPLTARF